MTKGSISHKISLSDLGDSTCFRRCRFRKSFAPEKSLFMRQFALVNLCYCQAYLFIYFNYKMGKINTKFVTRWEINDVSSI